MSISIYRTPLPPVATSLLVSQPGQLQLREDELLLREDLKEGGIGGELAEVVGLVPGEGEAAVEEKASESNIRSVDPGFRAEGISVADVEEEQADEDCGLREHP